jgi:hypothetical protein
MHVWGEPFVRRPLGGRIKGDWIGAARQGSGEGCWGGDELESEPRGWDFGHSTHLADADLRWK